MPPAAERPFTIARRLGALLALAIAVGILLDARADRRDRQALAERAAELGVEGGVARRLERRLAREVDGGERRLATARALLAAERARPAAGAPRRTAGRGERLAAARALALEALARLPASWEAALVAGAALAELRLAERDPRLVTAYRDWQRPLAAALERSSGGDDAVQALASAYVEIWPALAPERRAEVAPLVARAFAAREFRQRKLERWLELAGSLDEAARLLPDEPEVWSGMALAAWRRGESAAAVRFHGRARARRLEILPARLDAALSDADAGRRAVDAALAAVVAEAPLELVFAPLVERALVHRPAGPAPDKLGDAAALWLDWSRPLCLARGCPLGPRAIDRAAAAAGARLEPAEAAFAALAAGDLPRAERLARGSEALWSEPWAPYLLLEAGRRLAAGEPAAARTRLEQVHRRVRLGPTWRRLAHAAGVEGVRSPAASSWQPDAWTLDGRRPALELLPERAARGLRLGFHRPPAQPLLLSVEWDGAALPPIAVAAGAGAAEIAVEVTGEPHLLRVAALAGALPPVGLTTLWESPAPARRP